MISNSPVCNAIQKVVDLFNLGDNFSSCSEDIKLIPFSYKEKTHFEKLWGLYDLPIEKLGELLTIVVVWDGIASGNQNLVNTGRYLTPIDWAVGFSLSISNKLKKEDYPKLRIIILDLGAYSDSESLGVVDQFPKRDIKNLPWIRIINPVDAEKGYDLETFFRDLISPEEKFQSMKTAFDGKNPNLDIIKNLWAAFLTRPSTPGDHHALANLVGPLLLMGQTGDKDPHISALQRLMRALELIPVDSDSTSLLKPGQPWVDWNDPRWKNLKDDLLQNGDNQNLNFVLLDDMYQLGWGEILCSALGANYSAKTEKEMTEIGRTIDNKIHIKATSSAENIKEKLIQLISISSNLRFKFSLINKDSLETLFLDLRLFAGKDLSDEISFLKSIHNIAKRFEKGKMENPPWKDFSPDELSRINDWLNSEQPEREGQEYIDALSLLPRIIALLDPTYPIIIFSSTGRRDLIDKFKPYGNIFTIFDKPRFTIDIPKDIASQSRKKFEEVIDSSLNLLSTRIKIQDRIKGVDGAPLNFPALLPSEYEYAVIYIDESGSSEAGDMMVLGGILAIGQDKDHLNKFNNQLLNYDKAGDPPLNWGPNGLAKRYKGSGGWGYDNPGKIILNLADNCGIKLYGIALIDQIKSPEASTDILLDDIGLDNLHRNLLRSIVEIIISFIGPNLFGRDKRYNLSIVPQLRSIPPTERFAGEKVEKTFRERFGIFLKDLSEGGAILETSRIMKNYTEKLPEIYLLDNPGSYIKTSFLDELKKLSDSIGLSARGPQYYVMEHKDVYPIVAATQQEYRFSNLKVDIDEAKGIIAHAPGNYGARNIPQLSYLSDWFVHLVYINKKYGKEIPQWVKDISNRGFVNESSRELKDLLHTKKLFHEGAIVEAVEYFQNTSSFFSTIPEKLLLKSIINYLNVIPGESIISENLSNYFEKLPRGEQYYVNNIDYPKGLVSLKNLETNSFITLPLKNWESNRNPCPPLIGDEMEIYYVQLETGEKIIGGAKFVKPKNHKVNEWRFGQKGLIGKIELEFPYFYLLSGSSELGYKNFIKAKKNKNLINNLRRGTKVSFNLRKGNPRGNSPWGLSANDAVPI